MDEASSCQTPLGSTGEGGPGEQAEKIEATQHKLHASRKCISSLFGEK